MDDIQIISVDEMKILVEKFDAPGFTRLLTGRFYCPDDDGGWTAADNSAGECFVQKFKTAEQAVYWLQNTNLTPEEVVEHFEPGERDRKDKEAGLKDFKVYCLERLSLDVVVRAKSKEEAEEIAYEAWNNGMIDIDWDNCESCTCEVREERRINGFGPRDYDRYRRTVNDTVEEF